LIEKGTAGRTGVPGLKAEKGEKGSVGKRGRAVRYHFKHFHCMFMKLLVENRLALFLSNNCDAVIVRIVFPLFLLNCLNCLSL